MTCMNDMHTVMLKRVPVAKAGTTRKEEGK